jgi:hypothetical protein
MEKRAVIESTRVRRTGLGVLGALLLFAAPVAAQETVLAEREHEVVKGNTLWALAQHYYNNPFLWPVIHEANRGIVADPHWIYPAQRLIIPGLPTARTSPTAQPPVAAEDLDVRTVEYEPPARTMFYAEPPPPPPSLTELAREQPLAVRPGDFYSAPWLGDARQLQSLGRLVRVNNPDRAALREAQPTAMPFDEVFVAYARSGVQPQPGDRLVMVREGREIGRSGTLLEPTAIVTVTRTDREVFGARVTEQFLPVQRGDYAIPLERFPLQPGVLPRPVADGGEGVILGFQTEQALYGTTDRAFISLGANQGLRVGDQLVAFQPVRREALHELPPEPVARLTVVRVTEHSATVRITRAHHGVLQVGMSVRVVAEMP